MILSGQEIAQTLNEDLRNKIRSLSKKPTLAVILIGDHMASQTYVGVKQKACLAVGITPLLYHFPKDYSQDELLSTITLLNKDPAIHGILVQLPLPTHIDPQQVMEKISPEKDVDGFHPMNMGKLLLGVPGGFVPCTPLGIKTLLEKSAVTIEGKHVVIVGRSSIVGKPLAALLMQKAPMCNASVTVLHSQSENITEITQSADVLVAAVGIPRFIRAEMVREGSVVIDVGIHREEGRIIGDVDFENVAKKCAAISPVPKGVGPMTVAMLLQNTWLAYQKSL